MRELPATDKATISSMLQVGDKTRITRNDGNVAKFRVTEVTAAGIAGDSEFVAYEDISKIETKQVQQEVTGVLMIVTVAFGLLAASYF